MYNYAEALQKALFFYDAQKSGHGVTGGRVQWRGDSHADDAIPLIPLRDGVGTNLSQRFIDAYRAILDPDGDGKVNLDGGFHDAGDHVKFGVPQTYTAATLGWGLLEFRAAFEQAGCYEHMLELLRWFGDYLLRSTFRDAEGRVVALAYQVGDGMVDHDYWGPPELQRLEHFPRPARFATVDMRASDQAGSLAAALTLIGLAFKGQDAAYSARCIDTAAAIYRFGALYRGLGESGGYYTVIVDADKLGWAAVWLYEATGERGYLEDIEATEQGRYTGYLSAVLESPEHFYYNIWTHSWGQVWAGLFLKLAQVTRRRQYWDIARWNLEFWSGLPHADPDDQRYVAATPAGFRVLDRWGSARYNTTAQLCALIYGKHTGDARFVEWARGQMDYLMGQNPLGRSYIVGFGTNAVCFPHHRSAQAGPSMWDRGEHRHVLWGALVGGPYLQDEHVDLTQDYVFNEVALDYSAGFVGALAGLCAAYGQGQRPLPDFPPLEPPVQALYVEARLERENHKGSWIRVEVHSAPVHPPRYEHGLSARYYFNLGEHVAVGQSAGDVVVTVLYDEQAVVYAGATQVRGPIVWDESRALYYVELDWSGQPIYGRRELLFSIGVPALPGYQGAWDPSNDWSWQGLGGQLRRTERIPLYLGGRKIYGQEPG